jgi:hypothetical protein
MSQTSQASTGTIGYQVTYSRGGAVLDRSRVFGTEAEAMQLIAGMEESRDAFGPGRRVTGMWALELVTGGEEGQ